MMLFKNPKIGEDVKIFTGHIINLETKIVYEADNEPMEKIEDKNIIYKGKWKYEKKWVEIELTEEMKKELLNIYNGKEENNEK